MNDFLTNIEVISNSQTSSAISSTINEPVGPIEWWRDELFTQAFRLIERESEMKSKKKSEEKCKKEDFVWVYGGCLPTVLHGSFCRNWFYLPNSHLIYPQGLFIPCDPVLANLTTE